MGVLPVHREQVIKQEKNKLDMTQRPMITPRTELKKKKSAPRGAGDSAATLNAMCNENINKQPSERWGGVT